MARVRTGKVGVSPVFDMHGTAGFPPTRHPHWQCTCPARALPGPNSYPALPLMTRCSIYSGSGCQHAHPCRVPLTPLSHLPAAHAVAGTCSSGARSSSCCRGPSLGLRRGDVTLHDLVNHLCRSSTARQNSAHTSMTVCKTQHPPTPTTPPPTTPPNCNSSLFPRYGGSHAPFAWPRTHQLPPPQRH